MSEAHVSVVKTWRVSDQRTGQKYLCVISKRLVGDGMSFNQREHMCRVKNKEDRIKNGALWHTKENICRSLTLATDSHNMSPTSKVRFNHERAVPEIP